MDSLHLDQHISQQFNADLEHLRTELLEMGGMVEDQLANAIKSIETADASLAEEVLRIKDEVDCREVKIDGLCMNILGTSTTCCIRPSSCYVGQQGHARFGKNGRRGK